MSPQMTMPEREALNAVLSHINTDGADFIALDRALRDYRTAVARMAYIRGAIDAGWPSAQAERHASIDFPA